MKLTSFKANSGTRLGLFSEGRIVDMKKAYARMADDVFPREMISFLENGDAALRKARIVEEAFRKQRGTIADTVFDFEKVKILAPIPRTRKNIICLGLNYADHTVETNTQLPSNPVFFTKPPTSIIGPDEAIILPKCSKEVDYEAELAFVFGKRGKNISEEDAYNYIAGYTVLIDATARDLQRKHLQ